MALNGITAVAALVAAAVALAVVTVLYLLRPRRRRIEVPFAALWTEVIGGPQSSAWWGRLTRIGSWLIALCGAGLVIATLADPRVAPTAPTLHVLWIDASASMAATDVTPSRFERAITAAHAYVDRLPRGDAAQLVVVTARPVASTATEDRVALHDALSAVERTDSHGDDARAAALVRDVVAGVARARCVLFTDHPPALEASDEPPLGDCRPFAIALPAPATTSVAPANGAPSNWAITALAARPHPLDRGRAEVMLEVESFADADARIEVRLDTEGRTVEVLTLEVAGRRRVRRFFEDIAGLDRTIEGHLTVLEGGVDHLPVDDHAYARVSNRHRTRVAAVTDDDAYLEAALLLDEALEVTYLPPGTAPDPAETDVAIFDASLPETAYAGPAIYLRPDPRAGGVGPVTVRGDVERPRFDVLDDEHPLLRWASLRNVNVGQALSFALGEGDVVVAGDRAAPLLIEGSRNGGRFVVLAFDVRHSDLPLRVAWPVLLLDAITFLSPDDAREPTFGRSGEPASVPMPAGVTRATLSGENGASSIDVPIVDGRARLMLERAGVHALETDVGEVLVAITPAADLESALAPLGPITLGEDVLEAPAVAAALPSRDPWQWLALAAIVVLAAESVSFHRRWTV